MHDRGREVDRWRMPVLVHPASLRFAYRGGHREEWSPSPVPRVVHGQLVVMVKATRHMLVGIGDGIVGTDARTRFGFGTDSRRDQTRPRVPLHVDRAHLHR